MRLRSLLIGAVVPTSSVLAASNCSASNFASFLPSNASLNYAIHVPANGSFGGGEADLGYPTNTSGLPELCAVSVNVKSSDESSYNFGLYLPVSWNSRFLAVGLGGFGGGINWPDMAIYVNYGFASLSTDSGHVSVSSNGTWAYKAPETVTDWGYRAMHGSVELGKKITTAYYGNSLAYSYYSGCSTGGRQGLKEIEISEDSFDAALIGAPAWWTNHLQTWTAWVGKLNLANSTGRIPPELFTVIHDEVVRQCDPQDGLKDDIISDPFGCDFYPEALLCGENANTSSCLTPAQLDTMYHLHNDWVETNQTFVAPGYELGSESGWAALLATPNPLGVGFMQYFLGYGPDWDISQFNYGDVQEADRQNPGNATADNFDLSPFEKKGGKIIHYHGGSDPLIPTGFSTYFYKHVLQTMKPAGVELDDFYRFFVIPGMGHCEGSVNDAPFYLAGQDEPQLLTKHQPLSAEGFGDNVYGGMLALMDWVEHGNAPDSLQVTKFQNDTADNGILRERILCPFPQQAKYSGNGSPDDAANWSCQSL